MMKDNAHGEAEMGRGHLSNVVELTGNLQSYMLTMCIVGFWVVEDRFNRTFY